MEGRDILMVLAIGALLILGSCYTLKLVNEEISYCDDQSAPQYIRDPLERLRVCGRSSAYR